MKISHSLLIRLFVVTFLVSPAWTYAQSGDPEPVKMREHRQTGSLGKALDENCSIATRIDYVYRTTNNQFTPLPNPSLHPSDLAYTTTNEVR